MENDYTKKKIDEELSIIKKKRNKMNHLRVNLIEKLFELQVFYPKPQVPFQVPLSHLHHNLHHQIWEAATWIQTTYNPFLTTNSPPH